jgi:hypothetical protein
MFVKMCDYKHSIYLCVKYVLTNNSFGGLVVSMLASGTQVRGSDYPGEKILSMPSFGGEVNPFASCRRFAACKRSLNGVQKGVILAKLPDHSRPYFHPSLLGELAL